MTKRSYILLVTTPHRLILVSILLVLGACANLLAAGFTISPGTITNTYAGSISFLITNIASGATVRIEEFLDLNNNGAVDSTDMLVTSFLVTDGQVTAFGGVTDGSIPGDQDTVAGQITTSLSFPNSAEASRVAGAHLFRLSSPTGAFTSVVQPFAVTQFPYPQSVSGKVTSGGSPVANAFVGLLVPIGTKDTEFLAGEFSDASGNYSLTVPPGTYFMFTFKAGLVSGFGSPQITLNTNQSLSQNLTMSAGTVTINGSVLDAVTSQGIPAVQLLLQSATTNTGTLGFSDASGKFSFIVPPDTYKVDFSDKGLAPLGYLRPGSKPKVNATSGNVVTNIVLTKETSLIYGNLKTSAGQPLPGVTIGGNDSLSRYSRSITTDSSGRYTLGVLGGTTWSVGPDTSSPLLLGYSVQGTNVTLAANQAVNIDFIAQHASAHLIGRVTDNTGTPQAGITMIASTTNSSGSMPQSTTASDGSFDIGVFGGTWDLMVAFNGTPYNWMAPTLVFNVTDGVDISNINYVVQKATAAVTGWVHDPHGVGVPGANISASGTLNGTLYFNTATTDASGNYQLAVANGLWQVGVNNCLGYGCPTNNFQTVGVNGANVVVDFAFVGPAQLSLYFRHFVYGGDFGIGLTPVTPFPLSIGQYVAILTAANGTAYPPADAVFFTGPTGSGLLGTPATVANPGNNSMVYFSPPVTSPPTAPGGTWTIGYNGGVTNLNIPDPQAAARLFAIIPTASINGGLLTGISWVYKDTNGVSLAAAPQFVTQVQVQVFDKDLNILLASAPSAPTTTSYALSPSLPWSGIGRVRMIYFDTLGNRYFLNFNRATASLAGAAMLGNNQFEFQVIGLIGQNYTVQYSTTLTNWSTLYITNAPASLFNVVDPNATDGHRFYRIQGP